MTPYTPRNFAIGGPTAREGQLDRFFLQKWHFIYKLSVKKQRTGQKTGKNPPKKVFFRKRTRSFSGFPEKDPVLFRKRTQSGSQSGKGPGPFSEKLSQLIGGAGKTTFFGGFLPVFCPVLCFFTDSLYMKRIFKKKIGPSLLFLAAGTTDTKFLGSTGVTTANSTNKYQKYKSVELGDQLG